MEMEPEVNNLIAKHVQLRHLFYQARDFTLDSQAHLYVNMEDADVEELVQAPPLIKICAFMIYIILYPEAKAPNDQLTGELKSAIINLCSKVYCMKPEQTAEYLYLYDDIAKDYLQNLKAEN
jgi:hypothetical protein